MALDYWLIRNVVPAPSFGGPFGKTLSRTLSMTHTPRGTSYSLPLAAELADAHLPHHCLPDREPMSKQVASSTVCTHHFFSGPEGKEGEQVVRGLVVSFTQQDLHRG